MFGPCTFDIGVSLNGVHNGTRRNTGTATQRGTACCASKCHSALSHMYITSTSEQHGHVAATSRLAAEFVSGIFKTFY